MNVYDFDKTIFYPDSSFTFVKFCLRHYTLPVMRSAGDIALGAGKYFVGMTDKAGLKTGIFSFLPKLDNLDEILSEFWRENEWRIGQWYLERRRSDDVVVSASPEFLLRPIADKLGFELIATRMDRSTGLVLGANCSGDEKVRRFYEKHPGVRIEEFYSDSLSDAPLASHADKAFLVDNGVVSPWNMQA